MYDDTHYFDTTHDPINGLSEAGTNCSNLPVLFMGGGSSSNSNNINNSLEENLKISTTFSLEDHHNHHLHPHPDLAPHLEFELDQEFNTHLMQEVFHQDPNTPAPGFDQSSNWDNAAGIQEIHQHIMQEVLHDHHPHLHQQQQFPVLQDNFQCFSSSSSAPNFATNASSSTPDLLNLLHLPRCSPASLLPNSSISFTNQNRNKQPNFPFNSLDIFGEIPASVTPSGDTISASTILYDPPLHLNLPPQPPIFRELLHSLPHSYNLPGSRTAGGGGLFGGIDEIREGVGGGGGGVYQDGDVRQFENSVLDFRRERSGLGKGGGGGGGEARGANHFATERQRREQLNAKYLALKQLVPNPTKSDRASIVGDAIEYIKELLRTVDELKILVEKKRCGRDHKRSSTKRLKTDQDDQAAEGGSVGGDVESSSMKPHGTLSTDREQSFNGSLRSSWLQRKSKETEVDVRIIDDEVTIKLVQRKKMHCLLSVSRILDELQLDLLHVSGGNIGDYYSFLFNTKIYEGSSVYASAIAKKLIEAVDKQHAAFQPSSL